jgi:hypothetical protein
VVAKFKENPNVVTIVAAAESKTAWEYTDSNSTSRGVLREALALVFGDVKTECQWSWETLMLRVTELVRDKGFFQHSHVEGPYQRLPFSLESRPFGTFAFELDCEDSEYVNIRAGAVMDVAIDDVFYLQAYDEITEKNEHQ